jgi:hypothetical protein
VSAFSLQNYHVNADRDGETYIDCYVQPASADCWQRIDLAADQSLAAYVAAAQAHHEQHHRAPHLMDRQVQP